MILHHMVNEAGNAHEYTPSDNRRQELLGYGWREVDDAAAKAEKPKAEAKPKTKAASGGKVTK